MKKRLNFFIGHLFISVLMALAVIILTFFIWYPSPLAKAVGVTHIFLILIALDVVIGPLLGWLVYKEGKKTLKMDLTIIIFIQLLALLYGIHTIKQGRPVWVVFSIDQFEIVRANEVYNKNIKEAETKFQSFSLFRPKIIAVKLPQDLKIKERLMFDEILKGISLSQRPEYYSDLDQVRAQVKNRAQNINLLKRYNNKNIVNKTLKKYPQATAFIPLKANAVDMTVLINQEKGEVVKIVDLRPWK